MVSIIEMNAALNSFNNLKSMIQATLDLRDGTKIRDALSEVNAELGKAHLLILQISQECATHINRVAELEKQISALKEWETEKDKYELKNVSLNSHAPVFAYVRKESSHPIEPDHCLCSQCYNRGEKSILQTETRSVGFSRVLVCHNCDSESYIAGSSDSGSGMKRRK